MSLKATDRAKFDHCGQQCLLLLLPPVLKGTCMSGPGLNVKHAALKAIRSYNADMTDKKRVHLLTATCLHQDLDGAALREIIRADPRILTIAKRRQ